MLRFALLSAMLNVRGSVMAVPLNVFVQEKISKSPFCLVFYLRFFGSLIAKLEVYLRMLSKSSTFAFLYCPPPGLYKFENLGSEIPRFILCSSRSLVNL